MLKRFRDSQIPIWVNVLLVVLVALMLLQVYPFYFDHQALLDAGITIQGKPDQNILYTTAGRLIAMVSASVLVLITQNPSQYLVVLLMSVFREGQEMFIDPLFPYANAPAPPIADFGVHIVIVALEVLALIVVYRVTRREKKFDGSQVDMT